jgi:hypothetical protein
MDTRKYFFGSHEPIHRHVFTVAGRRGNSDLPWKAGLNLVEPVSKRSTQIPTRAGGRALSLGNPLKEKSHV